MAHAIYCQIQQDPPQGLSALTHSSQEGRSQALLGWVVELMHTCNLTTQNTEAGGLPQKFKANQGHLLSKRSK